MTYRLGREAADLVRLQKGLETSLVTHQMKVLTESLKLACLHTWALAELAKCVSFSER